MTLSGGRFIYTYGMAGKPEMTIVENSGLHNLTAFSDIYGGGVHLQQFRFQSGHYSYIVYSDWSNEKTVHADSGLQVWLDDKKLSDRSCKPYAEMNVLLEDGRLPEDDHRYSVMER